MPQMRHEPFLWEKGAPPPSRLPGEPAGRAYQRAARAMSSAGTPVTRDACSSVNGASDSRHASNPSVRAPMNALAASPSSRITRDIALKSATSVPGRCWIQRSA